MRKMVAGFNPELVGTLEVNRRADGTYAVIDGMHRVHMLKAVGEKTAPCIVRENLTPAEESALFRKFQSERQPLRPYDVFKAELFEEIPRAVDVNAIVTDAGFHIVNGGVKNGRQIAAVEAVLRCYARGNLAETLSYLQVWREDDTQIGGFIIDGLSMFLSKARPEVDPARLKKKMERISPDLLHRQGMAAASAAGGGGSASRSRFMALEFLKLYNRAGGKKVTFDDFDVAQTE